MLPGFREIKHHYNKPTETYGCEVLYQDERQVVLKYVSEDAWDHPGIGIEFPVGTITIAAYWAERGYCVWKMYAPGGKLFGSYVHIVQDMIFAANAIEYKDALLDIWFWPDGNHRVLDEDELQDACRRGQINREREREIQEHRAHVLVTWERIRDTLPSDGPENLSAPQSTD